MGFASTTLERYRSRVRFDKVARGTHCANCLSPCPYRIFTVDDRIVYEEPAADIPQVHEDVPDMNPLSCQKGAAWSRQLYAPDRVLYPLRRVGERGGGRWRRVTWDEALTEIADEIIDAIDEEGPESIIFEETTEGGLACWASYLRFASQIGAITLDGNGLINDFQNGQYMTFGKFSQASSVDDTFHSDVILIWHSNPAATSIPFHHYVSEARYRGAWVANIAPDYNPSSVGADAYVPVEPGTDAALALAMCQVMIEEDLADLRFVKEQTDLSLLVRRDTGRFLHAEEVSGGQKDDFFWWDERNGLTAARRDSLELGDVDPVLEGSFEVTLGGGAQGAAAETVEVTPVFAMLREMLDSKYRPEQASEICGVNPGVIRMLARKVAGGRTRAMTGFNLPKYYHGDLMERSILLVLALSGNWGKPGAGAQGLCVAGLDGYFLFLIKEKAGLAETEKVVEGMTMAIEAMREQDPGQTDEMAGLQLVQTATALGTSVPPVFFWYEHCGFKDVWNNRDWNDPDMPRPFDDYYREATEKGWWAGTVRPGPDTQPRVLFGVGTNALRRTRGARRTLLEHLWPKLRLVVNVDWRLSATAQNADIVLPAAGQLERPNLQYPLTHTMRVGFSDRCVAPQGESKSEWEIFKLLSEKVAERGAERNFTEYRDGRRQVKRLETLPGRYTGDGAYPDDESILDEWLRDSAVTGTVPFGASVATLREEGSARFSGLGAFAMGLGAAGDVKRDATFTAFSWHTEKKTPYPTLTRRAQFYIDHPWFIEADEALPRHKNPPKMGGDYSLLLTSGHNRSSIHSLNVTNRVLLETHRGEPVCIIGSAEAARRGLVDGQQVRMHNDCGSLEVQLKTAPSVRPGQVILYNGWEPFMFSGGKGNNEVEPGMVKWLHLVSRYGHLRYLPFNWQPVQSDRAVFVEVESLPDGERPTPGAPGRNDRR